MIDLDDEEPPVTQRNMTFEDLSTTQQDNSSERILLSQTDRTVTRESSDIEMASFEFDDNLQ